MNPFLYRSTKAVVAWVFYACASVAHAMPQQEPPQPPPTMTFQLGDSVTMPVRAVNAAHTSDVAFFLHEKDLLPESVAFDPKDGSFYVGSTRKGKIVRVDRNGNESDFVGPRQDGLWSVIGIKIQPTRRMLWACSFDGDGLEGYQKHDGNATGVFAFNLDTGKLIRKWVLDEPGAVHGFNDLVVTRGNDVYITHMYKEAAIYRITQKDQKLEVFATPEGLKDPNGIAITPDERTLFVAGADGVIAVDIASRKSRALIAPEGVNTDGIDGLYYFRGSLLGIRGNSVERYHLDGANERIVLDEVLETNHPLMHEPTTGVIVGDDFYYVANAQFDAVKPDGSLATDKLEEPVILKLTLH
ncbi:MAG TPA: SMP-30/gluconolactonase/LRE family protein [Candidatus Krumholzibacteria bacterium]|nr:SMP-30/gluconolactonase/LRE family protein [Candidatus Krumholzibacteria bacterium]